MKIGNLIGLILLIIIVITVIYHFTASSTSTSQISLATYNNGNISFQYPSDWYVVINNSANNTFGNGYVFKIMSPDNGSSLEFMGPTSMSSWTSSNSVPNNLIAAAYSSNKPDQVSYNMTNEMDNITFLNMPAVLFDNNVTNPVTGDPVDLDWNGYHASLYFSKGDSFYEYDFDVGEPNTNPNELPELWTIMNSTKIT